MHRRLFHGTRRVVCAFDNIDIVYTLHALISRLTTSVLTKLVQQFVYALSTRDTLNDEEGEDSWVTASGGGTIKRVGDGTNADTASQQIQHQSAGSEAYVDSVTSHRPCIPAHTGKCEGLRPDPAGPLRAQEHLVSGTLDQPCLRQLMRFQCWLPGCAVRGPQFAVEARCTRPLSRKAEPSLIREASCTVVQVAFA